MKSNKKQRNLDLRYLRMARIWAENSYCKRRQVGALVVKDKMIISDGFNKCHQTLRFTRRGQCHYQTRPQLEQQRWKHPLRHGCALYRMC